jgi:hypothetical protein
MLQERGKGRKRDVRIAHKIRALIKKNISSCRLPKRNSHLE